MSYNGFHNTWGYPKDTTYHGMKQYVTLAVENMNCGCCDKGCKCKDGEKKPEKVEEPTTTVPDNAGQDNGANTCSAKPLENYIDNTSIDEPSDFAKPCDKNKPTDVTERDKSEPLCTNECMSHTTADPHIDNIMKQFKNLDENDPCPYTASK